MAFPHSKIFGLDVGNIRRLYEQWGPSARTCARLSLEGGEESHEHWVENAAEEFVKDPPPNFKDQRNEVLPPFFHSTKGPK